MINRTNNAFNIKMIIVMRIAEAPPKGDRINTDLKISITIN